MIPTMNKMIATAPVTNYDVKLQAFHTPDCDSLSPLDAVGLSRSGKAMGYDLTYWGLDFMGKNDHAPVIAVATPDVVKFDRLTSLENGYIGRPGGSETARHAYDRRVAEVDRINTIAWNDLNQTNRDYLMSLLWVPEDPMNPLEALASTTE